MHQAHLEELDLNQFRVLLALLETGSVSRAARQLGLSQSATSHALGRLRESFADPLMVRGPGGMIPTARALALRPALEDAFRALARVVEPTAPFSPALAQRTFQVTAADYAEFLLLPPLMKAIAQKAPGIHVRVRGGEEDVVPSLTSGESDLALSPILPSSDRSGIHCQKLFDEKFVCLLRKGHPFAEKQWNLEVFLELGHVFIAPRGRSGGVVDSALEKLGKSRQVALQVPHFLVAPFVIAESDLVLTVPERVARAFSDKLPLVILQPPLTLPGFSPAMLWHERVDAEPAHRWFREILAKEARSLPRMRSKSART